MSHWPLEPRQPLAAGAAMAADAAGTLPPRFAPLTMEPLNVYRKPLRGQILKVSSVGPPLQPHPAQRGDGPAHVCACGTPCAATPRCHCGRTSSRFSSSVVDGARLATTTGLSPDIVAELKARKKPGDKKTDEALVFDFVTELTTNHQVSDASFARARQFLSEQQIVGRTTISRTCVTVAMLLAMAEVSVPPCKQRPFKAAEP
jgi:4-carboxymuconolactone decarboxylase